MNILHTVQLYPPSVGGVQEIVRQLSERLIRRGHSVTVATQRLRERVGTTLNGVQIEEFDISGNAVLGIEGDATRYQEFLRTGDFDVMLNYAAQQWATDLALPILHEIPSSKILVPCGFSALYDERYAEYFSQLPALMAKYDALVFNSEHYRDALFARRHGLSGIEIIPNGAAHEEFDRACGVRFRERYGIRADVPLVLTVGSHTGQKGHSLVLGAFRQSRTRRGVLALVGNAPSWGGCVRACRRTARAIGARTLRRKRVAVIDPPRPDVVDAFNAADVFAFGSQIECSPVVLVEAMASRTPFVSIAAGNAEEIATWGGGVVVPTTFTRDGFADARAADMANAIDTLLEDPSRRAKLGDAGHQYWREHLTWDAITDRYEGLYERARARRSELPPRARWT